MNAGLPYEVATLAGGCFWCLEAVFSELEGVASVLPGYTGGTTADPTYEQVGTGRTGHAESVQVTFDPTVISYRELLEIFFSVHDPTTLDRQGADVGTQYRSAIFYHDERQKADAVEVITKLNQAGAYQKPVVTQVVPLDKFYPAEEYHRDYYKKHPEQGYCRMVISPKVGKFRRQFQDRLKKGSF